MPVRNWIYNSCKTIPASISAAGFFWRKMKELLAKGIMLDSEGIRRTLARIAHEIVEKNDNLNDIVLLGIKTRGEFLAKRLSSLISVFEGISVPCEVLDISGYRDDVSVTIPVEKPIFNIDVVDKTVILVDDVLFTGRTARAGMEAVIKCGRPKRIQLAVLIDRGHRELPIRADYIGKNIPTSKSETIKVFLTEVDGIDEVTIKNNK